MDKEEPSISQEQHDTYVEALKIGAANKQDIKTDLEQYFPTERIKAVFRGIEWEVKASKESDEMPQYNTNRHETNQYKKRREPAGYRAYQAQHRY